MVIAISKDQAVESIVQQLAVLPVEELAEVFRTATGRRCHVIDNDTLAVHAHEEEE